MPNKTIAESWLDPTENRIPYWLRAANSGALGYAITSVLDAIVERLWQGISERFPEFASEEGLEALGRDRRIVRGPSESIASYRLRLIGWREAWRNAGAVVGMLAQTRLYFAPNYVRMRIVSGNATHARWTTIEPDNTRSYLRTTSPVWDWDSAQPYVAPLARSARWHLIVYPAAPYALHPSLVVPDSVTSVGSTFAVQQGLDILQIANSFRQAGARPWGMILAFDPSSFNPDGTSAYYPDGTWYRTYVAGMTVPNRDPTARYYNDRYRLPSF